MILIDKNKTIIAGEALAVVAELGAILDRLLLELEGKSQIDLSYEELLDRFFKTVLTIKKIRGNRSDISPQEILENGDYKDLFPEDFYNIFNAEKRLGDRSNPGSDSTEASKLLEEAMARLQKIKKESVDSTPNKKSKKTKKDKKVKKTKKTKKAKKDTE